MLKKRLIGVVTIKNGWAVQSFGYGRYLPLGKPECLVENLDRWGADEILVQAIDRTTHMAGPDFDLLSKLARLGLGTPLIYGGGIRTVEEGVKVIQCGADRIAVDAILHDDLAVVAGLCDRLGAQALIASMPLRLSGRKTRLINYRTKASADVEILGEAVKDRIVSEILITDLQHEGIAGSFDPALVDQFPLKDVPLIAFGGISSVEQVELLLSKPTVAAVGIGNFLSYREHAIQQLKESLASAALRPATYRAEASLLPNV